MTSLCTINHLDHHGHPFLDRHTVEEALRLAPDHCPDPADTEREIWMKAGARRLANRLLSMLDRQEEAI